MCIRDSDWTAPTAVDRILGRIDGSITKSELLTTESQEMCIRDRCGCWGLTSMLRVIWWCAESRDLLTLGEGMKSL